MKKSILLSLLSVMLIGCGEVQPDVIRINGELEQTIEVNTTYTDLGVTYPEDKYTLVTTGKVFEDRLGRYEIVYSIYTKEGELAKELHRFVYVVDTTAPAYTFVEGKDYYAGFKYSVSDFFTSYSDNYNQRQSIVVSPTEVSFDESGKKEISFSFKDESGNETIATKTIDVKLDLEKSIREAYKNELYNIGTGTNGIGDDYIRVSIDMQRSFTYYIGSTLHYVEQVDSNMGSYASIQISGTYGQLNKASLNYHVSQGSAYSAGFATFDATLSEVPTIPSFSSTINKLNYDEGEMLKELNERLPAVRMHFEEFLTGKLGIKVK